MVPGITDSNPTIQPWFSPLYNKLLRTVTSVVSGGGGGWWGSAGEHGISGGSRGPGIMMISYNYNNTIYLKSSDSNPSIQPWFSPLYNKFLRTHETSRIYLGVWGGPGIMMISYDYNNTIYLKPSDSNPSIQPWFSPLYNKLLRTLGLQEYLWGVRGTEDIRL